MNFTQIGDLAQSLVMRRQNTLLKGQLNNLTQELASGRKSDVGQSLSGDFALLGEFERGLTMLKGYGLAITDARVFTDTVQSALNQLQTLSGNLGSAALSAASAGLAAPIDGVIAEAKQDFGAIISALNVDVAGRALFAGAATDGPAVAEPELILAELSTALSGAVTVDDIMTRVDSWFMDPGGGFETSGYLGSDTSIAPFRLGENDAVHHQLRADASELRAMLRDTALAALAGDSGVALDLTEKAQLLRKAGEGLLGGQAGLTRIRSDLGFVQERVGAAEVQLGAKRSSLEIARNAVVVADPFETATRLEAAQVQLETLYTVTARMSRLSLVEYLR
ncbi:flagellin [Thiosulfatihalobacter marinus]|uniref:flagellin n=2 Tax=Thiosulfatihalobacter marinus TaxID=2792481 RepID=UPI0018D8D769|nr:flagellin [Thiosulfatihalobacter marinus]